MSRMCSGKGAGFVLFWLNTDQSHLRTAEQGGGRAAVKGDPWLRGGEVNAQGWAGRMEPPCSLGARGLSREAQGEEKCHVGEGRRRQAPDWTRPLLQPRVCWPGLED